MISKSPLFHSIPLPIDKRSKKVVDMALEIDKLMTRKFYKRYKLQVRISIHTNKVVAEVIGNKKLSYDLWVTQ